MQNLDLLDEYNDQVRMFCYSFFFWLALFGVLQEKLKFMDISQSDQTDINNRIVSIIHGQFALWTSIFHLFIYNPIQGEKNTTEMHFIIITSCGYFAYDLLNCVYYDLFDFFLIFHHFITFIALFASVQSRFSGSAVLSKLGLILTEFSNFPMHLRLILRELDLRHTKLYELLEISYFCQEIILQNNQTSNLYSLQISFRTTVFVQFIQRCKLISSCKICCIWNFDVLFLLYRRRMKYIIQRKLRQYQERNRKNIEYFWFSINPQIVKLSYQKSEKKDPIL